MAREPRSSRFRHGLSFLATLAFVGGFFGARLFHLAFPEVMVITQGIHFHHFWYGLVMVAVAGWLGIVYDDERLARVCALVFGVGLGFIGDEVGLLLTFDDYYSTLTFDFFVAAIAFIVLLTLLVRYRPQIEREVLRLRLRERFLQLGVFLVAFSALFFASNALVFGIATLVLGLVFAGYGYERKRRERAELAA